MAALGGRLRSTSPRERRMAGRLSPLRIADFLSLRHSSGQATWLPSTLLRAGRAGRLPIQPS
jgi:hypothetical protein